MSAAARVLPPVARPEAGGETGAEAGADRGSTPEDLDRVVRSRLRSRRTRSLLVTISASGLVAVVHLLGLFDYPALADDEGTYAAQAWAVQHGELAHYTYWYDHPPIGWIQLALLDWIPQLLLPGVNPVAASRVVVALAAAVSGLLTMLLGRRLGLSPVFATCAVFLAFLSPLSVTLQRQVYLDNLATPWVLLAFLLVLDRRQRLWRHVAAGAVFGVAILTKETTAVLLPLLCWAILRYAHPRLRVFSAVGLIAAVGLVIVYYPLVALLRGELWPGAGHVSLIGGLLFQFVSRAGSGAVWQAGSGSNEVVRSWLYYDQWLVLLGLGGLVVCLRARRTRLVAIALLLMVIVALKPGGYLPAMYIIVALPLLGLTAAAGLQLTWWVVSGWLRRFDGRPGRLLRHAPTAALATGALALSLSWVPALGSVMTTRVNDERAAGEAWLSRQVGRQSVVLTDDVTWLTLVAGGTLDRHHAVWFYKLDTDPAVAHRLPGGWRDVDYVFSTNELRAAVAGNPALIGTATALAHSHVVASFGSGGALVEVRRVDLSTPASPSPSAAPSPSPTAGSPAAPLKPAPMPGRPPVPTQAATPAPTPALTAPPPFVVQPPSVRRTVTPALHTPTRRSDV